MFASLRTFCLTALLALAAACTVGPSYRPPPTDLPQSWESAEQRALTAADASIRFSSEQPIDDAWWKAFQDPMLERLEQRVPCLLYTSRCV